MRDAQRNGHGEAGATPGGEQIEAFKAAVRESDAARVRALFEGHPSLKAVVDEPYFDFDSPAIVNRGGNREMVEVLLEAGADINARSDWWAGGFGVLDSGDADHAAFLMSRGARLDVHSAARLGMLEEVRAFIAEDPALVNARGGDGMTPLHFASTPEVVDLLLDHGAEIDLKDIDHCGTPAQHAVNNGEKCRHLLRHGATPDIFLSCAMGDLDAAKAILDADPNALKARIGSEPFTAPGGHIYVYELSYTARPLHLAAERGHDALVEFLLEQSTEVERFLLACARGDEATVMATLARHPDLVRSLPPEDMRLLADAAWRNDLGAARVMLNAGFDVNVRSIHDSTPLDRAAIQGHSEMVRLLLKHGASVEVKNEFGGQPLGACIWGSVHFRNAKGDYPACVESLIASGARVPDTIGGSDAVAEMLKRYGASG